jgi:predicted PurR-regulated permease PerM
MNSNKSQIFFGVSLTVLFVLSILVLSPFLITLTLAIIASVALNPVYKRITKLSFGNKSIGSIVTILLFYIIIFIPVYFVSAQLIKEAKNMYVSLDTPNASDVVSINNLINDNLKTIIPNSDVHIEKYVGGFSSWVLSNLGSFFTVTFDIFLKILLATIALFFLLKDSEKFRKNIKDLIPISSDTYDNLLASIETAIKSVVFGSIVIAIIQGIVSGIGIAIFGIPNATLLGTIAIIAAFIPGIGTGLVFIPIILYSFFYGTIFNTIGLLLWALIVVNIIDNLLRPAIMHKSVGIHPLFILFSVLGGISFIGPAGFILGPLILSLFVALVRAYKMKDISVSDKN